MFGASVSFKVNGEETTEYDPRTFYTGKLHGMYLSFSDQLNEVEVAISHVSCLHFMDLPGCSLH